MHLRDFDRRTRTASLMEFDEDVATNVLYPSPRLSSVGAAHYAANLRNAIAEGSTESFVAQLSRPGTFRDVESNGKGGMKKVPSNAAQVLGEGELNRFYMRGPCRRAISDGVILLEVYRARVSTTPRPESEARIGEKVRADDLLKDLRSSIGIETHLGIPSGPNSGLSVKL